MNKFAEFLKLKYPLIVAPMAGGPSSVDLVSVSSRAGALGSIGAAYSTPDAIKDFARQVRAQCSSPFAINLFIPTPPPEVSGRQILRAYEATEKYRDELDLERPLITAPYEEDFDLQFETVLKLKPAVFSFVFGLLKKEYVEAAKKEKIVLIGTATTLEEAQLLEATGVDAVTLQGYEAGGHRGLFKVNSPDPAITTFDLLRQCKDKIKIPLIAAGGIMTAEDVKSALSQGAEAVQMGTAFLTCKEAGTSAPYRRALMSDQRKTKTTLAFSGRFARGIENRFMLEIEKNPQSILPFPVQNKFTRDIRTASVKKDSSEFISLWSGTGQGHLWTGSAEALIESLFKP